MNQEEWIQKYLHSELTDQELIEFEQLVATDAALAEELTIRSIFYADRSRHLKSELEALLEQKKPSLLESALAYTDAQLKAIKEAVNTYLIQRHEAPLVMMDNRILVNRNWQIAIVAYQNKKYQLAVQQLQQLSLEKALTDEQIFYLGLCLFYQENPQVEATIEQFQNLLGNGDSIYYEEAKWYISLAYLEQADWVKAKKYLQEIVAQKSWQYKQASHLLTHL